MSQQIINISTPDDGLGDVLRNGFDKTNQNFTELYNGKVDKITGQGLSENNFTDSDKSKLDGIESGAEVNVQADWGETDPTSDSFILNKPPSLYASVGHFHYNDSATHTTPLVVLPSVPKKLTNDTLGVGTEKDFAPYGVADVWEITDNAFTFSPLDLGDQAQVRFDFLLSSASPSQKFTLYVKFGVGSPSEYDMLVSSWVEKDVINYGQIIRELSFSIDNEDWLYNQAEIYILSDDNAKVKVNEWYVPIIRKSVNIIDIQGGTQFKKKSESAAYNDPTLSGTDAVISLQPNGQSVYAFSNAGLTSIDGFGLDLIAGNPSAETPYAGKDILIYNNKATDLILKQDGSGTADVKFLLEGGVDLVIPAGGKVWLKYAYSYCEMIFKSWIDLTATQTALNLKENLSNKATNLNSPDNIKYPTTLAVVNENKKATITVELINQLTTNFYAPNALRINSTALISGSGTLVLKVNDVAYTLGNLIPQGAKITVETTTASVYNLISIYE